MKRNILLFLPIAILLLVLSFFYSFVLGLILTIIGVILIGTVFLFLMLNKMLKRTNWWRNQYLATEQFVSNSGYRDNIIRNYDIINLGSNPARFAFFYENVKGQSWATGSQGQDMDFEILKYYHSYLKNNGTVLIPIMPFSSIAPFLINRKEYWGIPYYSKFASILDPIQSSRLPYSKEISRYLKFPLLYNYRAVRYCFRDIPLDSRFQISEQPMMEMELQQDAQKWVRGWLKEFNLKNLQDVFDVKWEKYYNEAIALNKRIVDFCIERKLNPVFICVPMTSHLSSLFPENVHKFLVTDFVNKANVHGIPFLDYTFDERFKDDNLYFNSFFLNLRGRKKFTGIVLSDLSISFE